MQSNSHEYGVVVRFGMGLLVNINNIVRSSQCNLIFCYFIVI